MIAVAVGCVQRLLGSPFLLHSITNTLNYVISSLSFKIEHRQVLSSFFYPSTIAYDRNKDGVITFP